MNRTRITIDSRGTIAAALLLFTALLVLGTSPAGAVPRLGDPDYFPNLPLVNQDGETLHFYDDIIKDKVVTINFMFTSCGESCPLETAKLRKVYEMLGEHAGKGRPHVFDFRRPRTRYPGRYSRPTCRDSSSAPAGSS